MASSTGGNEESASSQENETDSVRNESQLLEDLDDRLDELRDKNELCDAVLRDLALLAKRLHGKMESTEQGHSH